MDRLRRGDVDALADLYDRYAGLVYALAVRVVGDRRVAEDVTQEVFVAMWEKPSRYDSKRGTLRGFLATMAHRRAVDVLRRDEARRAREISTALKPTPAPDPADDSLRSFDSKWVRDAVARLPAAQRRALELAYFHGRTYRQVADEMGIPEGTAKSRLRLGLQSLAESLRGEMTERWA